MAIYDLSSQPYSVGDLIMFQGAILVLCEHYKFGKVDISFVLNANRTHVDPVFAKRINPDNGLYNLLKILPIVQFNPRLGSVFIWENDQQLKQLLSKNSYGGVWPPFGSREYFFYPGIQLLGAYYNIHGNIPNLSPSGLMLQWAEDFYMKNVLPEVPVTVNIRNNPDFGQDRNSSIDVWIDFFNYCAGRYPVKFVIICGITEVDIRLRELPNVVIAKDHYTTLEQDMTLISTAIAHMGTASGPSAIATLSINLPFAVFNSDAKPHIHLYNGVLQNVGEYFRYIFSPSEQRLFPKAEHPGLLNTEFERIWRTIDRQKWLNSNNKQSGKTNDIALWLR